MTETEQLDAIFNQVLAWLKPFPQPDAQETLLQIVEIFEANGRDFIKSDYPAND